MADDPAQTDPSITDAMYGDGSPSAPVGDASGDAAFSSGDGAGETSFTETRNVSWGEKLSDSIKGVAIGFLLVAVTGFVLFWNEGRAVQTSRSLSEGAGLVVDVANDRVDPANEGKLIHLQGDLATGSALVDPQLGVQARAARLVRRVEMYQWKEESKTETIKHTGGGEERRTTYSYHRVWETGRVDSDRFHQRDGHANPQPRFGSFETLAQDASIGAFRPGAKALGRLSADRSFAVDPSQASAAAARPQIGPVSAEGGGLYLGQDHANPRIGDLRVSYQIAPLGPVSFIGRQAGSDLDEYPTKAGDRLLIGEPGLVPASAMFAEAQSNNRVLTWIVRLVATVIMLVGFVMILGPIEAVGDVIPIVGTFLGFGAGIAAFAMTAVLAPLIIAVAWFVYRPFVSVAVLAAGAAIFFGLRWLAAQKKPMPPPLPAGAAAGSAG